MVVVLVIHEGQRLETKFRKRRLAEAFQGQVKQSIPGAETYLYSTLKCRKPPEGSRPPTPAHLWCPYCNDWRRFRSPAPDWYPRCVICGISDEDFYVKYYNHLWNTNSKTYDQEVILDEKEAARREKRRLRAQKRRAAKKRAEGTNPDPLSGRRRKRRK